MWERFGEIGNEGPWAASARRLEPLIRLLYQVRHGNLELERKRLLLEQLRAKTPKTCPYCGKTNTGTHCTNCGAPL